MVANFFSPDMVPSADRKQKEPIQFGCKSKYGYREPKLYNYGFTTRLCNLHLNMTLPYLFTFYPFHVYRMSCGSTPKHARFWGCFSIVDTIIPIHHIVVVCIQLEYEYIEMMVSTRILYIYIYVYIF